MRRTLNELRQLTASYRLSQVVYAFTSLGMADALAAGSHTADEVANTVGAAPGPTARLLRAAAGEGVIDVEDGRYTLNDFSELLVNGVEGSLRDMVMGWTVLPISYTAFGRLDEAV